MWVLFYVWKAVGFAPFENVAACPITNPTITAKRGRLLELWSKSEVLRVFFHVLSNKILPVKRIKEVAYDIIDMRGTSWYFIF